MKLFLDSSRVHCLEILTDQDNLSEFVKFPKKKPCLIIKIPADSVQNAYVISFCKAFNKRNSRVIGKVFHPREKLFAIANKRRIVEAIDQLIEKFNLQDNEEVIEQLRKVKARCPVQTVFPRKEKQYRNYQLAPNHVVTRAPRTPEPMHNAMRVIKTSKPEQVSIFKEVEEDRKVTQLEAFSGICYRLLLNEQTPKVRSVRDDKGRRVGVLSRAIPSFTSLHDHCRQGETPGKEELINAKIGRIFAAAYLRRENDLHGGNVSYDKQKKMCYKIDHDQANFGITAKYFPEITEEPGPIVVNAEEIDNFPILKCNNPMNFLKPDGSTEKLWSLEGDGVSISQNPQFTSDAFSIFLKGVLLNEQVYSNIAEATITSEKTRAELVRLEVKERALLEQELLKSKKFIAFMQGDPDLKEKIVAEFAQYNLDYKRLDDPLRVNIEEIAANFDLFKEKCDAVVFQTSEVLQNENNTRSLQTHNVAVVHAFDQKINLILHDILRLTGKLGKLGGEKRTYHGQQMVLPRGAAAIFDLCIAYIYDDAPIIDTFNAIIAQAQNSKQETKHTFFNRRQPETKAFYNKLAAMTAAEVENSVIPRG